ncbi:MAG: 1-deoxy-D-xylulose-5-phosphate synthase N-terminal domain-containing protein [Candidatus Riflebacteria bacterium]
MKPFLISSEIIREMADETSDDLHSLAAAYRINCMAGLFAARHGWLGASFSCLDILACIYHRFIQDPTKPIGERGALFLSKGHAAMGQYAVLAGRGCFETERLISYKSLGGLPAHSDRTVPGVDSDSGSLGQGLSKAIGLAIGYQSQKLDFPVFTILGDGELQEGQVFEAFLSLKKFNLKNCITIIDRNYLQSDSQTRDIKDAEDWAGLLRGIGLQTITIDGHDFNQIETAIAQALNNDSPLVIIAETIKGGGCSLTSMSHQTQRRLGVWHGQIPDRQQYIEALEELVGKTGIQRVSHQLKKYLLELPKDETPESAKKSSPGTGPEFAEALFEAGSQFEHLFVLDADLEKSCRLTRFATKFSTRFIEVGISEQDMCSIASGLALSGKVPVVNTYASFFKRSLDQIFNAITEKLPVIFAAHYSGVDYHTDGKSHQSVNDIGLMRSMGEIEILEPLDGDQASAMLHYLINRMTLEWAEKKSSVPAYLRLHRNQPVQLKGKIAQFAPDQPQIFSSRCKTGEESFLFVCGPGMLWQALTASEDLALEKIRLTVVAVNHFRDQKKLLKSMVEKGQKIFTLEDHRRETGLGSFIAGLEFRNPVRIGVRQYLQSTLEPDQAMVEHQIDAKTVCNVVRKVLRCSHNNT